MTLNEWGLYKLDEYEKAKKENGEGAAVADRSPAPARKMFTRCSAWSYIEPELRESRGEVEAALEKRLPS
jgi:hypothetical protein